MTAATGPARPARRTAAAHQERANRWHDRAGKGEDGAITVLVLLLSGALLATAGLVWDGGLAISARQRAADLAEQAARAGADDLNLDATRSAGSSTSDGTEQIDTSRAGRDACHYLTVAAPKAGCAVTVTATAVTVTVTLHNPTALLGLIGVHTMTTHGRATAVAQGGVRTVNP